MELFDSHAHLMDSRYDEGIDKIIQNAIKNDVKYITNIGCDYKSSKLAVEEAENYENVYATIGMYPEYCNEENVDLSFLYELAKSEKVVAVGEIGLDYHREGTNKENQKKHFIKQIEIANELKLPVAIHSRDADMDMLEVLKNNKIENGFVMHCFSSSVEIAKEILKLGGYISISGTVTFKNAKNIVEVAKLVPIDRLLVETDSPYLTPEPNRGRRNEPANVKDTAQKIADVKEMKLEDLANILVENTKRLYRIKN